MFNIPQQFKNVERFTEILWTITDYELHYLLEHVGLKQKELHNISTTPSPERLRELFEDLGGAFIKLGQVLSLRPDLIPREYCEEFAQLQDNVAPIDNAEQLVNERYGATDAFILQPLASASIGQVHKAIIDEEPVAIKIRRPNIVETMQTDIEIIAYLAQLIEQHFQPRTFDPIAIVEEFKDYTQHELNYTIEAHNLIQARKNAEHVTIPAVRWNSEDILIMDYIEGTEAKNLTDHKQLTAHTLATSFFKQVFEDGFFHADPHPSNILVNDDHVALVDYGIVGHIDDKTRNILTSLFSAFIHGDTTATCKALKHVGVTDTVTDELRQDVRTTLQPYYDTELNDINLGDAIHDAFTLAREHDMHVPTNLVLLGKAVVTLEGTCRELDPSFNVVEVGKPYVERLASEQALERVQREAQSFLSFLWDMPSMGRESYQALQDADEQLQRIDSDITSLQEHIDTASNKITVGIIAGTFILSYAMTRHAEQFFGFDTFSFAVFITALIAFALITLRWIERRLGWTA